MRIEVQIYDSLQSLSEILQAERLKTPFALRKGLKEIRNDDLEERLNVRVS